MAGRKLNLKLVKSPYGRIPAHRRTLRSLGLRRLGQSRIHEECDVLKGKLAQVGYLLQIEENK